MDLLIGLKGHLSGLEISWDYRLTWNISADSSTIFTIVQCTMQTNEQLAIENF